jgi:hypothetical protein
MWFRLVRREGEARADAALGLLPETAGTDGAERTAGVDAPGGADPDGAGGGRSDGDPEEPVSSPRAAERRRVPTGPA